MKTIPKGIEELPKIEAKTFEELPLDLQRVMIDWCIEHRTLIGRFGDQTFTLPKYIQFVFFCKECTETTTVRFLTEDVVFNSVRNRRRCYRCRRGNQQVRHKTAVLDYSLIQKKRKRGLERHLSARAREIIEVLPFVSEGRKEGHQESQDVPDDDAAWSSSSLH